MVKEEFKKLDTIDKINYINSKLEKGQTVIRIREDLGIGEKALQKIIKEAGYVYNQKSKRYITTTETTTKYITIDLIDDKHLKPKPKSIRINEFIYQEWQEFCNKQHYSKMDLISMALKEYMEKYK